MGMLSLWTPNKRWEGLDWLRVWYMHKWLNKMWIDCINMNLISKYRKFAECNFRLIYELIIHSLFNGVSIYVSNKSNQVLRNGVKKKTKKGGTHFFLLHSVHSNDVNMCNTPVPPLRTHFMWVGAQPRDSIVKRVPGYQTVSYMGLLPFLAFWQDAQ